MCPRMIMCLCPLSTPRGHEHVPGPVPGILHQSFLDTGKFPWVVGGDEGGAGAGGRWDWKRVSRVLGTPLFTQASALRPVAPPCTEPVGRICMQKASASCWAPTCRPFGPCLLPCQVGPTETVILCEYMLALKSGQST